MYLQNKSHAYDVDYAPGVTIGDLRRDFEYQHCDYNFNHASEGVQRQLFDLFEGEARRLLALQLVYPGYEFVMKASHAFNLLDARGVLSHIERQNYVQRVRRLSEASAKAYLAMPAAHADEAAA